MATFFIEQFGCRATQADAAAIERQLCRRGYTASAGAGSADVIVVNTCTVTAAADAQARRAIHRMHRKNPSAKIVVTGCYAQRVPQEVAALEGVAWVVGNSHKSQIPQLVEEMAPPGGTAAALRGFVPIAALGAAAGRADQRAANLAGRVPAGILSGDIHEQSHLLTAPVAGGEAGHTRPIVKIQDGCDSRCAYCVIPLVRGRSRSLPPAVVLGGIDELCGRGAREVVLSGIDLGSYGRDLAPQTGLGDLLRRILDYTSIERLRVSSIEPMDVTEDLVRLFAGNQRLAQHFHMPLQSGSDRVLAAMRRWYRAEHYARRAELVREWLPDAGIGADVIAGFPGETDRDHRATLAAIEQMPLTYVHVFSFSPRPGTAAAEMAGQVPGEIIAQRATELRSAAEKKKAAFRAAQAGRTLRVLTLARTGHAASGPWTRAIAGNYLDVRVAGHWPANAWMDAEITPAAGQPVRASVSAPGPFQS